MRVTFQWNFEDLQTRLFATKKITHICLEKCTFCPTIATPELIEINGSIKWLLLASNDIGNVEKQEFNVTVDDCFKKLETKCSHFLRHILYQKNVIM